LITVEDRRIAVDLIEEAVDSGARLFKACEVLEISTVTFYRWKTWGGADKRKGAAKRVVRKLREEERALIVSEACSERFQNSTPYEIVAILLDEGTYIASVSSFYRVLRKEGLVNHRGNSRQGHKHKRPEELKATGPNQVWSWDITYLSTPVRGLFLFAYMIIDVWSRKIVGWEIHTQESAEIAEQMFKRLAREMELEGVRLHSDNGHPMKGSTLLITLYFLGVIQSFSRPRVSNDNPFIESFFKTVKFTPGYPGRFADIDHAREWMGKFVHWYNTEHRHAGIGYITPEQRHTGKVKSIMRFRNEVMKRAKVNNPQRWNGDPVQWEEHPVVYLNPVVQTRQIIKMRKSA
jgi:transposase InsO family protein